MSMEERIANLEKMVFALVKKQNCRNKIIDSNINSNSISLSDTSADIDIMFESITELYEMIGEQ